MAPERWTGLAAAVRRAAGAIIAITAAVAVACGGSLLCACGGCAEPRGGAASRARAAGGVRYLFVEGPYRCADQSRDAGLAVAIEQQRQHLEAAIGSSARPLDTRPDVAAVFAAADPRPLVVFYAGHATSSYAGRTTGSRSAPPRQSELCLRDGRIAVDKLLEAVNPAAAYVFLLLDACQSADVDVRRSPVPAAVLSASPDSVTTTQHGETALAGPLAAALACADADGDGSIDDGELLESLAQQIDQPLLGVTPIPRLRRQARQALPIVAARRHEKCAAAAAPLQAPSHAPAAAPQELAMRLEWSPEHHRFREASTVVIWHPGPVEDVIVTAQGRRFRNDQLVPIWCPAQTFGQCFTVRDDHDGEPAELLPGATGLSGAEPEEEKAQ